MKRIALFALTISLATFSFAECHDTNIYEGIACYEKELKLNKTKLNQSYQKLYKQMGNIEGQKLLENAQKSWLNYRNSHCNELLSHVSMYTLGAGARLINLSCHSELIEARIKQLNDLNQ